MTRTADVIRHLAASSAPVQPLRRPWTRAGIWCAMSLSVIGLLDVVWPRHGVDVPIDRALAIEQLAALATGLTAAAAAFGTVVPGYSRKLLWAPLVPLVVWLANVGRLCAREWSTLGHLPPIVVHWACVPVTIVTGAAPAVAIVIMLRRGAPMRPRLTAALAGLAVAGISNFGVRLIHPFDASFVVLAWHVVAVFALLAAASTLGAHVFNWRTVFAASGVDFMNAE